MEEPLRASEAEHFVETAGKHVEGFGCRTDSGALEDQEVPLLPACYTSQDVLYAFAEEYKGRDCRFHDRRRVRQAEETNRLYSRR